MTQKEFENMISEFEDERKFARNNAEVSDAEDREVWEIIEKAYSDLIYKLNSLNKP